VTWSSGTTATLKVSLQTIISESKPDRVHYQIVDEVVDSNLPLLDRIDETIDDLEDQALESPTPDALSMIFATKRTLIFLRN
jgi:magnesium transporter